MAIRNIVKEGDETLRKVCKDVTSFDDRLGILLDDMAETMYEADGVGLAAPQIGVLRRVVVIDVGDHLYEMVNPEIIEREGEQIGTEGCLSSPGIFGKVKRPAKVKVRALDRHGKPYEIEAEELFAVACCHEIDHLDGVLFRDKVIEYIEVE